MSASSYAETARWTQIKERGSLWGMRFTVWCYRVFGRGFATALTHAIVAYFFLTDRRGRRASAAYLRRVGAAGGGSGRRGGQPGLWQSFLHYRAFALVIVDRVALWFGRDDDFEFETHGVEYFDALAEQGRGSIVLGAHLGNFDALRLLAVRARTAVNVLMFTDHAQRINGVLRELSPQVEARVIRVAPESVQAVFEVRRCLERGEVVAILGDRVEASDRGRSSRVPFLGGEVELPQAPFLLANLLGCPVVFMVALREAAGRYQVFCHPLADPVRLEPGRRQEGVRQLLVAYAEQLERYCRRYPLQWFNFFDYWSELDEGAPR